MLRLMRRMFKLPMTVLVSSMDVLVMAVQGLQEVVDQGIDLMFPDAEARPATPPEGRTAAAGKAPETVGQDSSQKESHEMKDDYANTRDYDLSGDNLKIVRYRIVFTKRDYETTLDQGEVVVNYSTNGGSLGGIKVSEF